MTSLLSASLQFLPLIKISCRHLIADIDWRLIDGAEVLVCATNARTLPISEWVVILIDVHFDFKCTTFFFFYRSKFYPLNSYVFSLDSLLLNLSLPPSPLQSNYLSQPQCFFFPSQLSHYSSHRFFF